MSEARPSMAAGRDGPPPEPTLFPAPSAFRPAGAGPQETLVGQVAFAMAAESGAPPQDAAAMQDLRDKAAAALSDFAFRYLHNQAEEIRREAAAEATAAAARGPGFAALVLANLLALVLAGGAAYLLFGPPHLLAGLAGS